MNQSSVNEPLFGYYIGYATDMETRHKGSSGGVGTALAKYLLTTDGYDSVLSFRFNKKECQYEPYIEHLSNNLPICGSIYQDMDILAFLRNSIDEITTGIVVSCPPCIVSGVRQLMKKVGKKCFIISFNCSGQTKIVGTWKYYDFLGIRKSDVQSIQYRGNGWPSGIQIELKGGKKVFHKNWTEPWKTIQQSYLYRPDRCIFCKFDTSYQSDLSLADPWLDRYLKSDNEGSTMFLINSDKGKAVVDSMVSIGQLHIVEQSNYQDYYEAQKPNVLKQERLQSNTKFYKFLLKLKRNRLYLRIVSRTPRTLRLHISFLKLMNKFFSL